MDLARRRREQVGPAHHVRDALERIVDDDRELVGVEPVRAPHHEVADLAREILRLRSLQAVVECDARARRRAPARRAPDGRADPPAMPLRQVPG